MDQYFDIELDWLKQWALYAPQTIAFKDADSGLEYTYQSLFYLSCLLAFHLGHSENGYQVKPGDRVAVLATNEIEFLPLFFACQRLGAVLVPINFRLTAREVSHILRDSKPRLLVSQRQFQDVVNGLEPDALPPVNWSFDGPKSLTTFLAHGLDSVLSEDHQKVLQTFVGTLDSPCMILYTSGTTGAPKGALVSNQMLHWNSLNTTLRLNLSQTDVALSFMPFFHTGGWNVLVTPFTHRGAKTIIIKKFDADRVLDLCERENVTILFGVPTMMDMMARSNKFSDADLSTVRYAIVGGEPMPVDLIKTWSKKGVPVRQGYGLTEFGPNVFSLNEEDAIRKIGSIGFPNFYIQARVVDENGLDVRDNEIGELILRGPVCMSGYWENTSATNETIRDGWLHTGDLVRRDEEGYFYVSGRKKEMFISGGENVYPVEIERYLSSHPAVREVAVIGMPDEKWGEVGRAFVALNEGFNFSLEELVAFCAGKLAKFKIPKSVVILPDLPKGASGKILKRKLNL